MPKTSKNLKPGRKSSKPVYRLKKSIVLKDLQSSAAHEIKFQKLAENMNEAVLMTSAGERIVYANPKFCELTGYDLNDVIGQKSYGFWTKDSAKRIRVVDQEERKRGVSSCYSADLLTRDDKKIPVLVNGTPMPDGGSIGIMTDMREIRRKEAHLKVSKKLFDDLVAGSPIATFVINTNHEIVYWNKEMEKLSGMKSDKMIGTDNHWKVFYPHKRKMISDLLVDKKKIRRIISLYDHFQVEMCTSDNGIIGSQFFKNVGGRDRWLRFIIKPMLDHQNRVIGAIETVEDITERRMMSESLENRMREFQVLYQVNAHVRMVISLNKVLKDVAKDVVLICDEVKPARARIVFDGKMYSNLKKGEDFIAKIEEPIKVLNSIRGCIELGYIRETGNEDAIKFKFEKKVLNLVAQTISKHIRSREVIQRHEKLKELQEKIAEKTIDLQKANRRLRSLNELKDEFIAVTSHELRSPITAVRGYLSFLMEKEVSSCLDNDAQEYLTRAYDNLEILNSLVNNILDVSRIETDRFELHKVSTDIIHLLKGVIRNLNFQVKKNGLTVDLVDEIGEDGLLMNIDSIRIMQVFRNILENATKYTPKGKKITIRIARRGIGVQISVEDQGSGIPKSHQLQIFDKFKQVKNSLKRTKGGAGLGLFIVKKIVELHDGMIWVDSGARKGTIFHVQLPIN